MYADNGNVKPSRMMAGRNLAKRKALEELYARQAAVEVATLKTRDAHAQAQQDGASQAIVGQHCRSSKTLVTLCLSFTLDFAETEP
jgi:hypothetical protein